ncbi:MAG: hypothetical protein COZ28_00930 [Candidatus Moranbacteria bacterium CG_4_10_14_3_um_filter_44_15]|nr:MAG: hypothetical protein COS72_00825 [Candidatus Moranbacteria bacterium CG06_land_8_20_14_3_00_43_56]PIX90982.1 MAG: hypothetical protein COZ28_00930 [Candidatus Moranbacteria bacterium CG_4_10_14_3_um_filter_44_15]PJA86444.1 MAG: hypothetical protein CO142_00150 [Candidatus Moranbacteria bacterium CG_4_9_14_3_um_filter_44_28]
MIKKIIGMKVFILPLAVAFSVMFAVLFVKPVYSDMMTARKSVETNRQQLASLQNQNAKLADLKTRWESMEEKKMIQGALPEDQSVDDYMSELYSRVSRSGMLLKNFAIQESSLVNLPYVCGASGEAAAGGTPATAPAMTENVSNTASAETPLVSATCANALDVSISLNGTWEHLLGFLKYLGDTNRIANVKSIAVASNVNGQQAESNPDLLKADAVVQVYYKPESEASSIGTISSLTSGRGFNESVLEKIKNIIFSAYEEPGVSETGERNIFK